jgi:hypothetical protein
MDSQVVLFTSASGTNVADGMKGTLAWTTRETTTSRAVGQVYLARRADRLTPACTPATSDAPSTGSDPVLVPIGSTLEAAGLSVSQAPMAGQTVMGFHINFLAVIIAAVVSFVIGAVWYSPVLFAKPWMAAHGFTLESMAARRSTMARAYGISLICMLVMALVIDVLLVRMGISGAMHGARLGALLWLGFAATIGLTANVYSGKSNSLFLIDSGYQLVYMTVLGAILGTWL